MILSPPNTMQHGLFGGRRPRAKNTIALARNAESQPTIPADQPPEGSDLGGPQSQGRHWSLDGFDSMRSQRPRAADGLPTTPLGGSMRQPFDYQAALETLRGEQKKFGPWKMAAAVLADSLTGRTQALPTLLHMKNAQEQRNQSAAKQLLDWKYRDFARQNEADLRASNPFTIGRDRVSYNPATGQSDVVYDGAEDFELYAQELGLEPGTEEYFQAVEDYVLRSSGPSAHDRDMSLDDHRTANDQSLENLRYGNRRAMEVLRQGNRRGMVDYRNANPPPSRPRRSSANTRGEGAEGLVTVKSVAEARKLPKGTKFRTPDGKIKVR